MYCVKCGVKLSDTEEACPLCKTAVYHPDIPRRVSEPTYPKGRTPKPKTKSKAFNGALLILFLIPLFVSFISDFNTDGKISWFGYAAGAILLGYIVFALPLWFKKSHPIIFTPVIFASAAIYLWFVDFQVGGDWFYRFALPVTAILALIVCAFVTLLSVLKKGRLYVWGGFLIALGGYVPIIELLICNAFGKAYLGWSFYPLCSLVLLGGMFIFLAINKSAREAMERKLFF
ncbi:MAG: hypothetical protein IKT34_01755 [Clostridia bacterium]|nr:hypothetical protein [Clostridia bacterium]